MQKVLLAEEQKFSVTLAGGMKLFGSEASLALPALRKLQEELGGDIGLGWQAGRDDADGLDGTLILPDHKVAIEVVRPADVSREFLQESLRSFATARATEPGLRQLLFVGIDFPVDFKLDSGLRAMLEASDIDVDYRFYSTAELRPYRVVPGEMAFKLFDTYGFPIDLTIDAAREIGFDVDTAGFDAAMEAQRERSRAASRFDAVSGGLQLDARRTLPATTPSRLSAG